ncbi:hypothetical protein PVAG01_00797 [Phlyctema vagabunda]|uniref:Gamma interferon inducible lysosomal thiol reductase n=1 Tax=Phlyctema vagabunda TaxID=108571 RepID=A0ABR4PV89_9HELO
MVSLPVDDRSEKEFQKHIRQDRMVMRPARARRTTTRAFIVGAAVVALLYLTWTFIGAGMEGGDWRAERMVEVKKQDVVVETKDLVPLEAHIMSKCPDAQDCLKMLVLPAMQRVHGKVNFTLSYIGTPTDNDGVDCMHGPAECMGNIIELCAASLYPDPKIYLGFTMCLTRDYQDIPERTLVEDCALEHGMDFASLDECTRAEEHQGRSNEIMHSQT